MTEVNLDAQVRSLTGKQNVKKLKQKGQIPAVVYGKKMKSKIIQVNKDELVKVLHTSAGENVIAKLNIIDAEGEKKPKKTVNVIIKEIQQHPVTTDIIHVDFSEISLTEKITVKVPIKTKGDPVGVTRDNGVIEVPLWEMEVECLPNDIPEEIGIHVEELEIGSSIHIKDITSPEGVKILEDPEQTVILIAAPKEEIEEEPTEGEEGEEGIQEPEVIREKKEVEETQEEPKQQEEKPSQQEPSKE